MLRCTEIILNSILAIKSCFDNNVNIVPKERKFLLAIISIPKLTGKCLKKCQKRRRLDLAETSSNLPFLYRQLKMLKSDYLKGFFLSFQSFVQDLTLFFYLYFFADDRIPVDKHVLGHLHDEQARIPIGLRDGDVSGQLRPKIPRHGSARHAENRIQSIGIDAEPRQTHELKCCRKK